jgi:dihydrofolate reductase
MNNLKISIIVAMDEKRGIGKDNQLMWHIPGELPRFKQITMGHPIIMGRNTFESIGRVLPGRLNIVLSRNPNKQEEGISRDPNSPLRFVFSLEQAVEIAKEWETKENNEKPEIFIIGGGQIFKEALDKRLVDKLYLTLVKGDFGADTFFPEYPEFTRVISEQPMEGVGYKYTFVELEKD